MSMNVPDIPSLSSQVPAEVRRAFDAIRGWMGTARKQGGFVTSEGVRDELGGSLPPGLLDYTIPLRLTNFNATGAFRTIILSWDAESINYASFSYVEIYRNTVDELGTAELVGTTSAHLYSDAPPQASRSVTYYYWGRAANKAGVKGPYQSTAGVSAQTADDPAYLLELLTGEIRASELHADLTSRLDRIEHNAETAIANIGTITTTDYDVDSTYPVGAMVKYQGEIYKCVVDINSTPAPVPTNAAYWTKVGQYASLADMVAANASGIASLDTRTDSAEGTVSAHSTQINALESTVNNAATGVMATANAVSSLATRVTNAEGTVSSHGTAITGLSNRIASAETKLTSQATAVNSLETRMSSAEGVNTTQGTAITGLDNRITSAEGDIDGQATAISGLTTRVSDAEGVVSSHTDSIALLASRVGTTESVIATEQNTRATADSALTNSVNTLTATVNGNTAAIQTEQQVRAVTTGPSWAKDTTYYRGGVVVYANALYQCVSNHYSTAANAPPNTGYWKAVTGSLYAQYTVKTDVNGKVVGFGLANDGATSSFEIVVDKFAIVKADGTGATIPFAVNDAGQVLIREALIQNLTSTNIAAGGITADRFETTSLNAVLANFGYLTADTVSGKTFNGVYINGSVITGSTMQSGVGNSSVIRWHNSTHPVYPNCLVVFDANGVARVKLGRLS